MLAYARGWFRRSVFKTIRFLKHPRKLRQSPVRRWFARHFLDKRVWKPTQHTLSGGMAVGMFITLQLLPIQTPAAVIMAAIFRVNIPIAIALCWVSNPVTVPFMAWLEYAIGKWVLAVYTTVPTSPAHLPDSIADAWTMLKEHGPVMLVGGTILGAVVALISYIATWGCWEIGLRMEMAKKLRGVKAAAV